MLIHLIAAARPNFMKIAPLYHALRKEVWANPVIVHTGQHYDLNMSDVFFKDLDLPKPDIHLGIGSGSHAEQTGKVMIAYEKVLLKHRPDMVIVVGDVNSTMACTLAASKIKYPSINSNNPSNPINPINPINPERPLIAHLEAGLRSFDRTMPEEVNRIVTDALADILWTPSPDADENLISEGVNRKKIDRVGNIMIDSLEMLRDKIEGESTFSEYEMNKGDYGLVTLHRPSNVDDYQILSKLCRILQGIALKTPLIFPVHPRTRKNLENFNLIKGFTKSEGIVLTGPMNYIRFMNLVFNCRFVITDSGGIQEETTYLGIPCLTMRPNTERPITISQGTNKLCTVDNLEKQFETIISAGVNNFSVPELWDGQTASRVVASVKNHFFSDLS